MIHVANKYKHKPTENDFYIGRGSAFGNPFTHLELNKTKAEFKCETREEAIEKYKDHLKILLSVGDYEIKSTLNKIVRLVDAGKDVYLVCYCSPKSCHGDIIKDMIERAISKRDSK